MSTEESQFQAFVVAATTFLCSEDPFFADMSILIYQAVVQQLNKCRGLVKVGRPRGLLTSPIDWSNSAVQSDIIKVGRLLLWIASTTNLFYFRPVRADHVLNVNVVAKQR